MITIQIHRENVTWNFESPVNMVWQHLDHHLSDTRSVERLELSTWVVNSTVQNFRSAGHIEVSHPCLVGILFELILLPTTSNGTRVGTRLTYRYRWGVLGRILGRVWLEPKVKSAVLGFYNALESRLDEHS